MAKVTRVPGFVLLVFIAFANTLFSQTNAENPKFTLVISATKTKVSLGEEINIHIAITNISQESFAFTFSNSGGIPSGYQFDIRNEQGVEVPKVVHDDPMYPERLPGSYLGTGEIKPGKSLVQNARISEIYQITNLGEYTIRVLRAATPAYPEDGYVYSNIITVTVVPAASDTTTK
jgi:hypothetical protein